MKIGLSPAYGFAHFGDEIDCARILQLVRSGKKLGFSCFQLETYDKKQMAIYTAENIRTIRDLYLEQGMQCSQFIGHSIKEEIASIDRKRIRQGMEELKRLVEFCVDLGIVSIFTIPSSPPPEIIEDYYETYPGAVQPVIRYDDRTDWDRIWETHLRTVSECLRIINGSGMKMAIEAVPFGIISSSDSFLRLCECLDDCPQLGINLDTGHIFFQREPVHTAIYKLKERILGTHICDNDGLVDDHWIPPKGKIEWMKVLKALKTVGYTGTLDLEVNVSNNPDKEYCEGKVFLESLLGGLG